MTVKTGTAWAGTFVCLDATGALEAGTPAGVLYVDGVANGATVTISGSNPYKFAVTLPSLTAGQRVDMYITATIDAIATASVVASEQADTALVSEVKTDTAAILADTGTDGVVVASIAAGAITATAIADNAIDAGSIATGAITNAKFAAGAIDASAIATDAIGADEIAAGAVTKIQTGLATPTNITAGTITTVTNLTNLPNGTGANQISLSAGKVLLQATQTGVTIPTVTAITNGVSLADDAITSAKFDENTAFPVKKADALTTELARKDSASTYMADVSGLALDGEYDADFTQVVELLYSIMGGEGWTDETLVSIQSAIEALDTNSVLLEAVDGTYTLKEAIYIMVSILGGKLTRVGDTLTFRDLSDTTNVVVAETDEHKQRIDMTYTV